MKLHQFARGLLLAPFILPQQGCGDIDTRQSVLTQHNDNARSGSYSAETILKPSNVADQNFGFLYTLEDEANPIGPIVAQPLFVKKINISGKIKDVLYVATRSKKIYAFDVSSIMAHMPLSGE